MKRSSILAHRGFHLTESEKNSELALIRALEYGFGLETDIRDLNGRLVISHDPPTERSNLQELRWLFEQISARGSDGRIALNIKADGLENATSKLIQSCNFDYNQLYVFDMSVPDSISYLSSQIPFYVRISEYEEKPAFMDNVYGVWVDDFTGRFPQVARANDFLSKGIRVAIVSPELHHRDHRPLWEKITRSGIYQNPLFELCTDLPCEAANQFCNS
jgi:hypothetical protein